MTTRAVNLLNKKKVVLNIPYFCECVRNKTSSISTVVNSRVDQVESITRPQNNILARGTLFEFLEALRILL